MMNESAHGDGGARDRAETREACVVQCETRGGAVRKGRHCVHDDVSIGLCNAIAHMYMHFILRFGD